MIPLFIFAAAAAAAAGTLAGRWARKRPGLPHESASNDDPIALGDVLLLQGGLGRELWIVRRFELREVGGDPFLVLFEADGPASKRAIVAWNPVRPERVSVLSPQTLPDVSMLTTEPSRPSRATRPPSTLDVVLDGATATLKLEQRRTARGTVAVALPAPGRADGHGGESDLPREGETLLTAIYVGDEHGQAIVVRDDHGLVRAYVGRQLSLDAVSVLRNREPS